MLCSRTSSLDSTASLQCTQPSPYAAPILPQGVSSEARRLSDEVAASETATLQGAGALSGDQAAVVGWLLTMNHLLLRCAAVAGAATRQSPLSTFSSPFKQSQRAGGIEA